MFACSFSLCLVIVACLALSCQVLWDVLCLLVLPNCFVWIWIQHFSFGLLVYLHLFDSDTAFVSTLSVEINLKNCSCSVLVSYIWVLNLLHSQPHPDTFFSCGTFLGQPDVSVLITLHSVGMKFKSWVTFLKTVPSI